MSIFGALHKDKMTISRYEEVKKDGITRFEDIEKYTNIACRLSKEKLSNLGDGNIPVVTIAHKIFTGPSIDIHKGDKIVLTEKSGRVYKFIAGESFPYDSHLEIDVRMDETA